MALLGNNNQNVNHYIYCPVYKLLSFAIMITLFLTSGMKISAFEAFHDEEEKAAYTKGIGYRNENKWQDAIKCFEPLAEKQYVKAQHNLAFCLFKIGDDLNAYRWARQASNHGFKPSKANLDNLNQQKLNFMDSLLPIEMITRVVSYFSIRDIAHFNLVSHRASRAVRASVTSTNFLTSKKPYAVHFRSLFDTIHFEPKPKALRVCLEATVDKGPLEVHFRDIEHLKRIVAETPLMQARDRLYFVQDDRAQDEKELVASEGVTKSHYVIIFTADTPLEISGEFSRKLTRNIRFPEGSDLSALKISNQNKISMGDLTTYRSACDLEKAIATVDDQLVKRKTLEALNLLKNRKESRRQFPTKYPELQTICPSAGLITAANLSITPGDYIDAMQSLIYMAPSIPEILKLQHKLPTFEHPIFYINPRCAESGVYCDGQFEVQKGFEISTDGDLTVAGRLELPNYNLKFSVGGSLWLLPDQLTAEEIALIANGDIIQADIDRIILMNSKPAKMSTADWNKLLQFWRKMRRI